MPFICGIFQSSRIRSTAGDERRKASGSAVVEACDRVASLAQVLPEGFEKEGVVVDQRDLHRRGLNRLERPTRRKTGSLGVGRLILSFDAYPSARTVCVLISGIGRPRTRKVQVGKPIPRRRRIAHRRRLADQLFDLVRGSPTSIAGSGL
jgi:hypothetical protein